MLGFQLRLLNRRYLHKYSRHPSVCRAICPQRAFHRLSITSGHTEPPLLEITIPQHFASIVSQYGDRPAVISRSPETATVKPTQTTLTYRSLDEQSNRLANSLQQLGVCKGDRVAISLGNTSEFAALTYAVFKLGAILVPLNPAFNVIQVESALQYLDAIVLIIGAATDLAYKPTCGRLNLPLLQELVPNLQRHQSGQAIHSEKVPNLRHIIVLDNLSQHPGISFPDEISSLPQYRDLLCGSLHPVVPDSPLDTREVVNIQLTSGSTSMPKAAMLSHRAILNNGALIAGRMGLEPGDRIVVPPPLFHCFGSILGYMATATTGAAILFPSPAFDPVASLKMCIEQDATGLYGVVIMLIAMLEVLADGKAVQSAPKNVVKGIVAGSSVPEALMRELYAKVGLRDITICYGMTETAPVSCMTAPTDSIDKRTQTVGRPLPHTSVKIVDPSDPTRILPLGERGEVAVTGYLLMQGYWKDDEKTNAVSIPDQDGVVWVHSGDEGRLDEDGYITITGRIKDLIIRGGENIRPTEIENCLLQHPDILDANVVGVPDDKYGECVGVFVIVKHGVRAPHRKAGEGSINEQDIKNWVAQKLSSHLVPKYIFWVEEYPKTASGKVQKFKLREMAKELCVK